MPTVIFYILIFLISAIMVSMIPSSIVNLLRDLGGNDDPDHPDGNAPAEASGSANEPSAEEENSYNPSPVDIGIVRIMLARAMKIPPTLIDEIFEHAEYWASSSNEVDFNLEHQAPMTISGSRQRENTFLLRSFPIGLTGIRAKQDLSEELAYDLNEAKPLPLQAEHEPSYFAELADYPTPKLVSPVRKIVFSMRSHDQGWASGDRAWKGTYKGTWTWFEAGLERFDKEQTCDPLCTYDVRHKSQTTTASPLPVCALRAIHPEIEPAPPKAKEPEDDTQRKLDTEDSDPEPEEDADPGFRYIHPLHANPKWTIQQNKRATRDWQDHKVTWHYHDHAKAESDEGKQLEEMGRGRETGDGEFVRGLKMGDVVTVWGKARFPGWENTVEKVKIQVYWAV